MLWDPILIKILLKKYVCESYEQCTESTGKAWNTFLKKKKKVKCRCWIWPLYPNGYLINLFFFFFCQKFCNTVTLPYLLYKNNYGLNSPSSIVITIKIIRIIFFLPLVLFWVSQWFWFFCSLDSNPVNMSHWSINHSPYQTCNYILDHMLGDNIGMDAQICISQFLAPLGAVWHGIWNNSFRYLNNITRIFTLFHLHVFQKNTNNVTRTTLLNRPNLLNTLDSLSPIQKPKHHQFSRIISS